MQSDINKKEIHKRAIVQHGLNELDKVVDALIVVVPPLGAGLYLAKSFVGYAMVRRQEELNTYVEFIKKHPEQFSQKILESEDFQNGFVSSLEAYLKLRSESKRFVARQILLGFAGAVDMQAFPLERMQDTLTKVSDASIAFIAFVESEIMPLRRLRIEKKVDESNLGDNSREWWIAYHEKTDTLSIDIGQYLFDKYHPSGSTVKGANGGNELEGQALNAAFEIEKTESEKVYDAIGELTQLGVMGMSFRGATWGDGGGTEYSFTKFGKEFIEYVKSSDFSKLLAAS